MFLYLGQARDSSKAWQRKILWPKVMRTRAPLQSTAGRRTEEVRLSPHAAKTIFARMVSELFNIPGDELVNEITMNRGLHRLPRWNYRMLPDFDSEVSKLADPGALPVPPGPRTEFMMFLANVWPAPNAPFSAGVGHVGRKTSQIFWSAGEFCRMLENDTRMRTGNPSVVRSLKRLKTFRFLAERDVFSDRDTPEWKIASQLRVPSKLVVFLFEQFLAIRAIEYADLKSRFRVWPAVTHIDDTARWTDPEVLKFEEQPLTATGEKRKQASDDSYVGQRTTPTAAQQSKRRRKTVTDRPSAGAAAVSSRRRRRPRRPRPSGGKREALSEDES